jgi:hypothetical protein
LSISWHSVSSPVGEWQRRQSAILFVGCGCGFACAADVAAGHNALRGSGPNRKHAFKDAMTQAGSPDPRIDLVCITSLCPRQFVETPGLCCWQQPRFLERFCAGHQSPGHACNLVGKRNGGDLDWPARHDTRKPEPARAVLPRISDHGHDACNEQPSQIPISLL